MLDLSPQKRRYLDAAVHISGNQQYESMWPSVLEREASQAARIMLAILANFSVYIDRQLQRGDKLSREERIMLNNDLWYISDFMEEIVEQIREPSNN
jgi:hypothetical protein